jgi:HPt (histidine-containing phosphotransfer) domain-containing protein
MTSTTPVGDTDREPTSDVADVIDFPHLRRFTLDNPALELEVLRLFADHLPVSLALVTEDASPKDWAYATHTLKGAARAVGAHRLTAAATAAEQALPSDRTHHIVQIRSEADRVVRFIATLSVPTATAGSPETGADEDVEGRPSGARMKMADRRMGRRAEPVRPRRTASA